MYIQPGKPQLNAYVERFNRMAHHELTDPVSMGKSGRSAAGCDRVDVGIQS